MGEEKGRVRNGDGRRPGGRRDFEKRRGRGGSTKGEGMEGRQGGGGSELLQKGAYLSFCILGGPSLGVHAHLVTSEISANCLLFSVYFLVFSVIFC